ncbi:hypothetical protein GWI33_002254 [Rhynchophorus ferrugineus]|uniref:Uncharacterized protein n=1 Tax=Rhynchophorus ferrugineus TaxID=354439 RepID=A0A834HRZ2_RHYFE|nr:hypothetical protein GWI33_002254 [Rhynchophorus ferrugineus]
MLLHVQYIVSDKFLLKSLGPSDGFPFFSVCLCRRLDLNVELVRKIIENRPCLLGIPPSLYRNGHGFVPTSNKGPHRRTYCSTVFFQQTSRKYLWFCSLVETGPDILGFRICLGTSVWGIRDCGQDADPFWYDLRGLSSAEVY